MSTEPIFAQLEAEFIERSKYCRLGHGPLVGEDFERVEVIDEHFGTIGYITQMISVEEPEQPVFLEMTDEAKEIEPKLELNGFKIDGAPATRKLYIVEGAPELIDLGSVPVEPSEEAPGLVLTEADFESTMTMESIESDKPEPPSTTNDVQFMPLVTEESLQEDQSHVTPIKRLRMTAAHKKNSATGTISWFTNKRVA